MTKNKCKSCGYYISDLTSKNNNNSCGFCSNNIIANFDELVDDLANHFQQTFRAMSKDELVNSLQPKYRSKAKLLSKAQILKIILR